MISVKKSSFCFMGNSIKSISPFALYGYKKDVDKGAILSGFFIFGSFLDKKRLFDILGSIFILRVIKLLLFMEETNEAF